MMNDMKLINIYDIEFFISAWVSHAMPLNIIFLILRHDNFAESHDHKMKNVDRLDYKINQTSSLSTPTNLNPKYS